jgi:hypothetical protein
MCFELAKLADVKWLASLTEESAPASVQRPVFAQRAQAFFADSWAVSEYWDAAPERAEPALPVSFEPEAPVPSRTSADVFVLTVETELYAVMYDKRERIQQHALSQI